MASLAVLLQMGGALPVVGVLLGVLLVAIVVSSLRGGGYHDPAVTADSVVCPRCHHSTAAADTVCPECGEDL